MFSYIIQVLFLPLSNTMVTCFKDDSLFVWDSETLKCKFQLPVPPEDTKQPHYKTLATPRDGRLLVAGGRWVHIQNLPQRCSYDFKFITIKKYQIVGPKKYSCNWLILYMCYNWLNLNENLFWFFFLHLWCYFPPVFSSNLVQKLWPWINSGIATHFFLNQWQ